MRGEKTSNFKEVSIGISFLPVELRSVRFEHWCTATAAAQGYHCGGRVRVGVLPVQEKSGFGAVAHQVARIAGVELDAVLAVVA